MSALLDPSLFLEPMLSIPGIGKIEWMDPQWLLERFGAELFWISLAIIFVECGLFFPFLPGDSLLFALGIFFAGEQIDIFPGGPIVELLFGLAFFTVAAVLGNIAGYEIGRAIGPKLYERDGKILKKKYFDQTAAFFDEHGNKALVIGRFVPFVRTYVTVVAGVTQMDRRRFFTWSLIGALAWVISITVLGYFLGSTFPALGDNIDLAILAILAFSIIPITWEFIRHKRTNSAEAEDKDHDGRPDRDILGQDVPPLPSGEAQHRKDV
ncbi:DedA family protein [Nocardioides yefusunii]|uniref:DedA family protein n=1 Tax=Nocardioides yefusunii TaxID=2500546 RepID=A0ABW1QX93_9ACTN|nr:VTT domain-containing protein [Nocardioides yefusunii]